MTTSTSSDDDENDLQSNTVGYLKLKTRPKQKFLSYLNSINTSRYFYYKHLHIKCLEKTSSKD